MTIKIKLPDYREFPGLPIKTVISMNGNQITARFFPQGSLADGEFAVPKDFRELSLPDMGNLMQH